MKRWLLVFLLSVSLVGLARADDLNARAAQVKAQLQTTWLPAWAKTPTSNKSATEAAQLLETLSHAHRLGYSSASMNLLEAARTQYVFLRDARGDKTGGGFFADATVKNPALPKSTIIQAQVVLGLVEYSRASGEAEPRGLAIKTWRLLRDRARDQINGGYFNSFLSGPLSPTQASGLDNKGANPHRALLEAGAELFRLTRDRSIRRDVEELLDLNEGCFFPTRDEEAFEIYTPDWRPLLFKTGATSPPAPPMHTTTSSFYAGSVAIVRAEDALGLPVGWVDFVRRTESVEGNDKEDLATDPIDGAFALEALTVLARDPASREHRAAQIDEVLGTLNGQTPDVSLGTSLLDFVAAFDAPSSR